MGTVWATQARRSRDAQGRERVDREHLRVLVEVGAPPPPAYHASKGAINALTRQMAVDYGKDDIRVNTIVVGFVFTGSEAMARDPRNPDYGPRS